MKWIKRAPVAADMLRVRADSLYHYGIFVSESEVIQFGKNPRLLREDSDSENFVCSTTLEEFLCGEDFEVAYTDLKCRTKEQILSAARAGLGESGYDILYNNCEHFANFCYTGERISMQTEALREKFRSIPMFDIYVARIPEHIDTSARLYPKERDDEVRKVSSAEVMRHKYYAWRLLERALLRTFGYKIDKINFSKDERGKWSADSLSFSISHSGDYVAVALSRRSIGVDIQLIDKPKDERFARRVLSHGELEHYYMLSPTERPDFLITEWSIKEAIFKSLDDGIFSPSRIDTDKHRTASQIINLDERRYVLSACGEDIDCIRIIYDVKLD